MKNKKASAAEPRQHGHPYGVQPWGNFYLKQQPEIRTAGTCCTALARLASSACIYTTHKRVDGVATSSAATQSTKLPFLHCSSRVASYLYLSSRLVGMTDFAPDRYENFKPLTFIAGLGLMSALSDDLLLGVLYLLPAADLARLGLASKALYCFAHTLDLWKALAMQV
eukprot:GHUV01036717.1.p1 GENE.GHUV01036717.1~~GHUV01036717.1.p1  ORF type:complete len:168 (+),score=27.48 GHUV01036717.1:256-759(+)